MGVLADHARRAFAGSAVAVLHHRMVAGRIGRRHHDREDADQTQHRHSPGAGGPPEIYKKKLLYIGKINKLKFKIIFILFSVDCRRALSARCTLTLLEDWMESQAISQKITVYW